MTILDLDIRIIKAGDTYRVTAQSPESGLAEATLDAAALFDDAFQEKLAQVRDEPFTTDLALFQEIGDVLFRALFRGQVQDLFFALYSQWVQRGEAEALRLRLHIDERAVELATLPWEFMHREDVFLATQRQTLFTRQLLNLDYGATVESLRAEGPPRVLMVIPQVDNLDTEKEERAIAASLDAAHIPYRVLKGRVTLQDLDEALAQEDYAILHFIGHGEFQQDAQGEVHGRLRLNAAEGDEPHWVNELDLQSLLGNHASLKLVVLNACEVGEVSARPEGVGFWGVIPSLLRAGIPAVVAMQYAIRDDVAALFGETFYRRLTTGKWAGQVDVAVTLARNACRLAFPDDRGFATPILYLRAKDGRIFDVSTPAEAETTPCASVPRPPDRLLYRYRNVTTEDLIDHYHVLAGRLQRILSQMDALVTDGGGQQAWRLRQYEKNRDHLEREMDQVLDVLQWRGYEACQELFALQKRVAQKERERDALEEAGRYVPYDLKNDIFRLHERILALEDVLGEIEMLRA